MANSPQHPVDDTAGDETVAGGSDGPRAKRRLRIGPSLELSAFALMATTVITSLFGLVFWAVAAQHTPAEVGRSSAVLSTATTISMIVSMGIGLLFTRILPVAGARSRSLVLAGYGGTVLMSLVLGGGFVLLFREEALFTTTLDRLSFPLLVVVLSIFVLQDWVLIGLRSAHFVPIEQFVFAFVKLGLLVLFSTLWGEGGIVASWGFAAGLAVVVVNPFLLGRMMSNRPPPPEGSVVPARREFAVIIGAEYATSVPLIVVPLLLPLVVVTQLGTQANAYFALPWMISQVFTLLVWNMTSSYMVEASNDRRQAPALMRRTFRLAILVGGLGTPFFLVSAPWLLALLGGAYAQEGSTLLRLMALAFPFTVIANMYTSTARVRHQMGRVVAVQLLTTVTVVGLSIYLVGRIGIVGAGVAYLTAEALAAVIVIVPLVRLMRADGISVFRSYTPPADPAPVHGPTEPVQLVLPDAASRLTSPDAPTTFIPIVRTGNVYPVGSDNRGDA